MRATTRFLSSLDNAETEVWRFNDVLTTLRSRTLELLGERAPERLLAEDLFQLARDAATHMVLRLQTENRIALEQTWITLNDLGTALGECSDEASFGVALDRELPRLNLKQAFVSRYVRVQDGGSPGAQLVYAMDKSLRLCAADTEPFDAAQLFPAEVGRRVPHLAWVVLPLFFGQRSGGFAVVQLHVEGGAFYEVLRIHLSVGLSRLA